MGKSIYVVAGGIIIAAVATVAVAAFQIGWPFWSKKPNAIVLASIESYTLDGIYGVDPIAPELVRRGYVVRSFDLPCHDLVNPHGGLFCWNQKARANDPAIFDEFCTRMSAAITEWGVDRVQVVGISRGGYVASRCAAVDARINDIALMAPAIDLSRLAEFDGTDVDQEIFGLDQFAGRLSRRNVRIDISENDSRVGTDAAISFGRLIGAEVVVSQGDGHGISGSADIINWLVNAWSE